RSLSNGAAVKSSDTEIILVTTDGVSNGEGLLRQYPAPLQRAGEVLLLSQGIIGTPEQRVYGIILEYDFPNLIHVDVSYDGSRPITGIRVSEIGNNPHTTAALIGGG
ncbi:hypothetical protein, partial [Escherichia coli]|uniref:hypothetical protein n=1 Tax=Escherichia coli TaxID=562 RepID=UPI00197D9853